MAVLYENHQRARRARLSLPGAVVWALGWFYWAYILSGGDTRGGIIALAVGVGLLPLVALYFYGNAYVVGLSRDDDEVTVTTLGLIGPRNLRIPVEAISGVEAKPESGGIVIRVVGRSMPLLVDLQAERINIDAIAALHRGAGAPT